MSEPSSAEASPSLIERIEAALKAIPSGWQQHLEGSVRICDGRHLEGCHPLAEVEVFYRSRAESVALAVVLAAAPQLLRDCLAVLVRAQEEECTHCKRMTPRRYIAIELRDGAPIARVDGSGVEQWCVVCHDQGVVAALQQHLLRSEEREQALKAKWQPIETAPKDEVLWFWVRPKTSEEAYVDTSGNPIFTAGQPRIFAGKFKTWSALHTADYWMRIPWPVPPERIDALSADTRSQE